VQVNEARTAAREAEWKLSAAENKANKVGLLPEPLQTFLVML
jgi:hypothetical protein